MNATDSARLSAFLKEYFYVINVIISGVLSLVVSFITNYILKNKLEKNRYIENREMENYSLYIKAKHDAYINLNKLLIIAQSNITRLFGARTSPALTEFNKDDLTKYLESKKLISSKILEFTKDWNILVDTKERLDKIHNYLRIIECDEAHQNLLEAQSHYWLTKIYYSDQLTKEIDDILKDLTGLYWNYNMVIMYGPPPNHKETREENEKYKISIENKINAIIKIMKTELSMGYYNIVPQI